MSCADLPTNTDPLDLATALDNWAEAFTPISWFTGEPGCQPPAAMTGLEVVRAMQAERARRFDLYAALARFGVAAATT